MRLLDATLEGEMENWREEQVFEQQRGAAGGTAPFLQSAVRQAGGLSQQDEEKTLSESLLTTLTLSSQL